MQKKTKKMLIFLPHLHFSQKILGTFLEIFSIAIFLPYHALANIYTCVCGLSPAVQYDANERDMISKFS